MTEEEKQLLLKDLCARLKYKTYVKTSKGIGYVYAINISQLIELSVANDYWSEVFNIDRIKPYLRPMSSMTEEEREEFYKECEKDYKIAVNEANRSYKSKFDEYAPLLSSYNKHDWLNANHFDYRGLIPMGLALEAREGMYKNE